MRESTQVRHRKAMGALSAHLRSLLETAETCEGDLLVVEAGMRAFFRAAHRIVATSSVATAAAEMGVKRHCPRCGSGRVCRSRRKRRVVSSEGEATYRAVRHRCESCHCDHYPFEEVNDLVGNQFTIGARAVVAETAAHLPYTHVSEHLQERGLIVSAKEADRIAQEVSGWRKAEEVRTQKEAVSAGHVEEDAPITLLPSWNGWGRDTPALLSVDGAQIRSPEKGPQGCQWFECRGGVIAAADERCTATPFHTAGVVEPEAIFQQLHAGWQSDRVRNRPALFIADGAPWIWSRAPRYFPEAIPVLDVYHAAEHVAEAAKAAWGEGSPQAQHWRRTARERLMTKDGPARVRHTLRCVLDNGNPIDRTALNREVLFLETHKHRMPYYQLKQRGLPIGSGAMESAIKQVATTRLRGAGMKWTRSGADGMLTLRAAVLSKSLDATIARRAAQLREAASARWLAA